MSPLRGPVITDHRFVTLRWRRCCKVKG